MIPTKEQLEDFLRLVGTGDEPDWCQDLPEETGHTFTKNVLKLAIVGLLVHPETSGLVQAELDYFDAGDISGIERLITAVRNNSLALEGQ
jgi:hypothetical protein